MIELDRFVHTLSGEENETLERSSRDSSATSKYDDRGLAGYLDAIKNRRESETWCGLPHHLLLPSGYFLCYHCVRASRHHHRHRRCKTYDCTDFKFAIMVFMNDLEDPNVSEGVGADKEHMSVQFYNLLLLVGSNF